MVKLALALLSLATSSQAWAFFHAELQAGNKVQHTAKPPETEDGRKLPPSLSGRDLRAALNIRPLPLLPFSVQAFSSLFEPAAPPQKQSNITGLKQRATGIAASMWIPFLDNTLYLKAGQTVNGQVSYRDEESGSNLVQGFQERFVSLGLSFPLFPFFAASCEFSSSQSRVLDRPSETPFFAKNQKLTGQSLLIGLKAGL